eukprot:scaffold127839_cov54-Cyclotella_meneghiniana.AAC.4
MVYYRDELGLHKCVPNGQYKYQIPEETVQDVSLKSHPIPVNLMGPNVFWTKRQRRMARRTRRRQQKKIEETLPTDTKSIDLISDAAVHVEQEKGALCWRAVDEDERIFSQRFPVEVQRDRYSYRQELIGMFHALKTVIIRFPQLEQIKCHCDNKAGIEKMKQSTFGPG